MRQLVGPTDVGAFQNLDRQNIFSSLPSSTWESVVDFGSGCGRLARRLMLQKDAVEKYLGLDLHKGMVDWCQANLTLANPNFTFIHHNAFNLGLNPSGAPHPQALPFNIPSETATLVLAWSVFTHLVESQVMDYLLELRRLMRPEGLLVSTWFLFDKGDFPMMQDFQNFLYINAVDPTNAAVVDKGWLLDSARKAGLVVVRVLPPSIRGFQWTVTFAVDFEGIPHAEVPEDNATRGRKPPPVPTTLAHEVSA